MTLKVGESYRGVFAGDPCWLGVTSIQLRRGAGGTIYFRALGKVRLWRWLWWITPLASDIPAIFVNRLEQRKIMDEKEREEAHRLRETQKVKEVEVKYR